jgi:type II secretory pathway component GspD/PulD (secretin)
VVEVTLSDPSVQAVDWKAVAQRSGEPWDGTGTSAGVRVRDFAAVLSALAAQGTVRTLASPQLLAMNNEPALMRVGTQDVVFTFAGSSASAKATADKKDPAYTNHGEQPAAMTHGFTMTVTPHVDAGGMVQLSLAPTFTEKTGTSLSRKGNSAPVVSIAEIDTVVRIRDGESVMVTGMLQRKDAARCELVILLNATIVTPGPEARAGAR